jgi:hypothetical protein
MRLALTTMRLALTAIALFGCLSNLVRAADQELTLDLFIDKLGDATVAAKTHFTAKGWLLWNGTLGEHPDLAFRFIRRQFPKADIYDFTFQKDPVYRNATFGFKAHGFARLQGDGRFSLGEISPARLVANHDRDWIFELHTVRSVEGGTLDETMNLHLAPEAVDAKVINQDSPHAELVYFIPVPIPLAIPFFVSAICLGIAGILLLLLGLLLPRKNRPIPPSFPAGPGAKPLPR